MDVELIRDWIIIVFLNLMGVASCIGISFVVLIAVKVMAIMDAAKETVGNVRGD